ncbi:MAG: hypothetical protein O2955_05545 [Planctomycetota bacterium]|nr:hypothetical protein [Planctomycetota bacterium]MDA1211956.1 hypothetical protein [Planctomycetota bacterium]
MLQFIRYAALARPLVDRLIIEAPISLANLFATVPGVDEVVVSGQTLPDYSADVYLLDLPRLLGTTLETVPRQIPYLTPPPDRMTYWANRLKEISGFKVGLCWQGSPHFPYDRIRSIPFAKFHRLFTVEGVAWISLQQGPGRAQLDELRPNGPVFEFPESPDEQLPLMSETAAVMSQLDLVITSDTSVAHLSGGLGIPTWLVLSRYPEWRWLWDRESSPWYPSMRIFRQQTHGNWNEVFSVITDELNMRMNTIK